MGTELQAEFSGQLDELRQDGSDTLETLGTLAPLILYYEPELTEDRFRQVVNDAGIDVSDEDILAEVTGYMNMWHYGGLLTITEKAVDTWLDAGHPAAFFGAIDEEFAGFVEKLAREASEMKASSEFN